MSRPGPAAGPPPLIAIVDYGIGNLHSAHKGFEHVGADARLTDDHDLIRRADGVVLPGVGAFGPCMAALTERGLDGVVRDVIDAGRPFFGICIGMQLLARASEEAPGVAGLGVLDAEVRRLPEGVPRPQIQWNVIERRRPHPLFGGLDDPVWMYFVHSYALEDGPDVIATCDYGGPQAAALAVGDLWAAQFHPEKSGRAGLRVLANFVDLAARRRASVGAGDREGLR